MYTLDIMRRCPKMRTHLALQPRYFVDHQKPEIWALQTAGDVLGYYDGRRSLDLYSKALVLKQFAQTNDGSAMSEDPRLLRLLKELADHVEDMEGRALAISLSAAQRARNHQLTAPLVERLEKEIQTRDDISPREMASICLSLSALESSSSSMQEFCRQEAMKGVEFARPSECTAFLEAFRRWGIYDRVLVDMIVEKLQDDIDECSAQDVTSAVIVMARLNLARGFLIRRLCSHAFGNLHMFTTKQCITLLYGLAKLRFTSKSEAWDLLDHIQKEIEDVKPTQACDLLYALAMIGFDGDNEAILSLIEKTLNEQDKLALIPRIDLALAIVHYRHLLKERQDFHTLVKSIWAEPPPKNRGTLVKGFDLCLAMELECLPAPESWRVATLEAERIEQGKTEKSRLHQEILLRLQELGLSHAKSSTWSANVRVEDGHSEGGILWADFALEAGVDGGKPVVVDIDTLNRGTNRRIKMRRLQKLGYKTLTLNYWSWRKCRSAQTQSSFLKEQLATIGIS
eukprot:GEMP01049073.1.p1 GENE.GEMP01049073.1~~GEMP01049073.1.p1  ORF type:complete len:513 (+),score=106.26 GEMP01049073.1:135-1673(+)